MNQIVGKRYIEPPGQQKIPASTTALRVCADPNNLPFSNERREGFENKIADVIAGEMDLPVEYTWWAQRRGFFRNTLRAGMCDVVIGVPATFELAATTRPYYRSTYVFVSRKTGDLNITSLDDTRLRELKIGVQMIGDDGANSPPVHALNNRGLVANLKGYTLYGNYAEANPPARVVDAVRNGEVDIAIVWGPLAGFFAGKDLTVTPVTPELDPPYLPFAYDIAVGVRRGEDELLGRINEILIARRADIEKILDEYKVPRKTSATMVSGSRSDQMNLGLYSSADRTPIDWSAGILACMSAKHEEAVTLSNYYRLTPLNYAALPARMPGLQSVDDVTPKSPKEARL